MSRVPNELRRMLRPWVGALRSRDERDDLVWELRRRMQGEPAMPSGTVGRVLVVCYGNICRSPFAEHVLARLCPDLAVRSAGFEARDGDPANPEALRVAAELGFDLAPHKATRMTSDLVEWADLILGMSGRHGRMLEARWPRQAAKLRLLGDFLEAAPYAIEDPYGRPTEVFHAVYDQILRANARLADRLPAATTGRVAE